MDRRLAVAAETDNVQDLRNLMQVDRLVLKPAELTGGENPLHIACIKGHIRFVKEVLHYRMGFAKELNADGLSPLHIASAYGYLDIVEELLKMGPDVCLIKAKDGQIPLHYAIAAGNIEVMKVLMLASFLSFYTFTDEGETCFHIAVKHDQLGALKHLTTHVKKHRWDQILYILNAKDGQQNSILHLAASRNQFEVLDHLLDTMKPNLYINSLNCQHHTPLDVLPSNGLSDRTTKLLEAAGAKRASDIWIRWHRMFDIHRPRLSDATQNALLVVIAVIAAATVQAVNNPPGGVWQETIVGTNSSTSKPPYEILSSELNHVAGTSILATINPSLFYIFLFVNTAGFMTSCVLTLLLTGPTGSVVWLALSPLALIYASCAIAISPYRIPGTYKGLIAIFGFLWGVQAPFSFILLFQFQTLIRLVLHLG